MGDAGDGKLIRAGWNPLPCIHSECDAEVGTWPDHEEIGDGWAEHDN